MSATRTFCVHLLHADRREQVLVQGRSFEDAALAYAEDFGPAPEDGELAVLVREAGGGAEQCFRIDLTDGQIDACG